MGFVAQASKIMNYKQVKLFVYKYPKSFFEWVGPDPIGRKKMISAWDSGQPTQNNPKYL